MSTTPNFPAPENQALPRIRRFLLAILLMETVGIVAELLLLEHTEAPYQWTPFVLTAMCYLTLAWWAIDRRPAALNAFRLTMVLFVLSGAVGTLMHYQSKVEFQLEWQPELAGMELFKTAMLSPSPPSLAPGAMAQMGLLGLVFAYGHPARRDAGKQT